MSFVHLHVHSTYSDGTATPEQLLMTAKARGYRALALTDHTTLDGLPEFVRHAEALGMTALPGIECTVYSRLGGGHLVILFTDQVAQESFSWYLHHRRDHLRLQDLARIPGLYVTSSCLGGLVAGAIKQQDYWSARDTACEYRDLFGSHYFLEVQPSFGTVLPWVLSLGRDLAIPLVATNDVHYLGLHDTRNQIGLHLATEAEMRSYSPFTAYQGALENAAQIAQQIRSEQLVLA